MRPTAILALLLAAIGPAFAEDGQRLADACMTCHGLKGEGSGAIPPIAGGDADTISATLTAFRAGKTPPSIMTRLMRGYSDAEIAALATYLASLK